MITRALIWILMASVVSISIADDTSFTSGPFSLELRAPKGWRLLPAKVPTEQFEVSDKELKEYFKTHKDVPIVSVIKPVEKGRGLSPAVQIYVMPSEGLTPKEFLSFVTTTEAKIFDAFRIVREPENTTLNTMRVAMVETAYTAVFPGDRRFATLSRKWAIPRKDAIFMVVLTGSPDDIQSLQTDIEFIMKSIRFTAE